MERDSSNKKKKSWFLRKTKTTKVELEICRPLQDWTLYGHMPYPPRKASVVNLERQRSFFLHKRFHQKLIKRPKQFTGIYHIYSIHQQPNGYTCIVEGNTALNNSTQRKTHPIPHKTHARTHTIKSTRNLEPRVTNEPTLRQDSGGTAEKKRQKY